MTKGNGTTTKQTKTAKQEKPAAEEPQQQSAQPIYLLKDDPTYGHKGLVTADPERAAALCAPDGPGWRQVSREEWATASAAMHAAARKQIAQKGA